MRLFADRSEAGWLLASALAGHVGKGAIVLAIPRGGVVLGYEIARVFGIPLDVIIPRKLGAPRNPELAIGAMAEDDVLIVDESIVMHLGVTKAYIREEARRQGTEMARRLALYRGDRPYPALKGRTVIIVDDGMATGSTMKAALASVRKKGAGTIIIAVPVGPASTVRELEMEADMVLCLQDPEEFYAVGQFYRNFDQVGDEEVMRLLDLCRQDTGQAENGQRGELGCGQQAS